MKVLLRFNKKDNSFVDMQSTVDEYVFKYQDVEELPNKDGYYTMLEYDERRTQKNERTIRANK